MKIPLLKDITRRTLHQINYSFEYVTPEMYQILFHKQAEKEEIEIGIKQLDAGQRVSVEDFLKRVS